MTESERLHKLERKVADLEDAARRLETAIVALARVVAGLPDPLPETVGNPANPPAA